MMLIPRFRKIQSCKLTMILPGRDIVGVCGGGFGFEPAEPKTFAQVSDTALPEVFAFDEPDADEPGSGVFSFLPVLHIL